MADFIEVARLDEVPTGCTLHVKDFGVATYPVKIVDRRIMVIVAAPPPAAG